MAPIARQRQVSLPPRRSGRGRRSRLLQRSCAERRIGPVSVRRIRAAAAVCDRLGEPRTRRVGCGESVSIAVRNRGEGRPGVQAVVGLPRGGMGDLGWGRTRWSRIDVLSREARPLFRAELAGGGRGLAATRAAFWPPRANRSASRRRNRASPLAHMVGQHGARGSHIGRTTRVWGKKTGIRPRSPRRGTSSGQIWGIAPEERSKPVTRRDLATAGLPQWPPALPPV